MFRVSWEIPERVLYVTVTCGESLNIKWWNVIMYIYSSPVLTFEVLIAYFSFHDLYTLGALYFKGKYFFIYSNSLHRLECFYIVVFLLLFEVQCVGFGGICWQNMTEIYGVKYAFINVKSPENNNHCLNFLRMS